MNNKLYSKSIKIILENQSEWGSYIASPSFPTYHFCWLRDSSFIAHAMDTAGEHQSAANFFRWVGRTILKHANKLDSLREKIIKGQPIGKDEALHTRFSLEGEEVFVDEAWGNFQIDGYGTWLWALAEHIHLCGDDSILDELTEAIRITLEYLALVWQQPNYDCWEEYPKFLHPYSLAAVFAGFNSIAGLLQEGKLKTLSLQRNPAETAAQVKKFIVTYGKMVDENSAAGTQEERLAKMISPKTNGADPQPVKNISVDSSLLGAIFPYQLLGLNEPLALGTLHAVERDLQRKGGGVYRYRTDEYYGGGEWILLSAWLGWVYTQNDEINKAKNLCTWIESCADENGYLAEQVSTFSLQPDFYQPWIKKWGPIASPLLWSHAMYIILVNSINKGKSE